MKRLIPFVVVALAILSCEQNQASKHTLDLSTATWIDLSYAYDTSTIYWPTADEFSKEVVFEGETDSGYYYSAYNIKTAEHGGTHIDAPIHFSEGKETVDEIPLDRVIGSAIVVDVTANASQDRDYLVSVSDFENWEATHGRLPDDIIILVRTGFGTYWPDAQQYMGTTQRGAEAVANLHFPGLDPDAATWLTTERKIKSIGLDTPSIDYGQSTLYESHRILFEKNVPAFENLANLDQLPETGVYVVALPMKIKGGSGAPLRIIATVIN